MVVGSTKRRLLSIAAAVLLLLALLLLGLHVGAGEKKIQQQLSLQYDTADPQFRRSMSVLLGPPLIDGNQVQSLLNGDEIFAAMLADIRAARRSITFETYIYWADSIGREFAQALSERARAGVKVHVMLDWVGSAKLDRSHVELMRGAGVEVERFHEPRLTQMSRMNNRTHRKLLIIDGTVGFTGGVGIADKWRGNAQDPQHWRDTHFRVQGPVVAQMQAVFMDNWIKATGRVLDGEPYFPQLQPRGNQTAQMFSSSPAGGSASMHLMYLMAINAARRSIDLSNSYFVPDELTIGALVDAARRGVKIRIIVPGGEIDAEIVRRASRALWGDLLEAGLEMHVYQPTMYHCKVVIVDGLL
ncbi:MAG TPA: phospholipase D-like domain-containing protein, partial [Albitalea sp.]|nr:phospholipase D-like domain-containing protein [Albitalea sp.]